jgi:hypothetical protein
MSTYIFLRQLSEYFNHAALTEEVGVFSLQTKRN